MRRLRLRRDAPSRHARRARRRRPDPAGPSLFTGYRLRPELTAEVRDGDWFVTQDLGAMEDGRLRVRGRVDDVINTGGEKVVAGEVAAALSRHPAVRDVVVVGRPDPEWGERVTAVVVPAPPPRLSWPSCAPSSARRCPPAPRPGSWSWWRRSRCWRPASPTAPGSAPPPLNPSRRKPPECCRSFPREAFGRRRVRGQPHVPGQIANSNCIVTDCSMHGMVASLGTAGRAGTEFFRTQSLWRPGKTTTGGTGPRSRKPWRCHTLWRGPESPNPVRGARQIWTLLVSRAARLRMRARSSGRCGTGTESLWIR